MKNSSKFSRITKSTQSKQAVDTLAFLSAKPRLVFSTQTPVREIPDTPNPVSVRPVGDTPPFEYLLHQVGSALW